MDDDELTRIMLYEFLTMKGFDILLADGVDSAIEAIGSKKHHIRMIVTDYCMPRHGDGMLVLECARESIPMVPVALMTGSDFEPKTFIRKGFVAEITKSGNSRRQIEKLICEHLAA